MVATSLPSPTKTRDLSTLLNSLNFTNSGFHDRRCLGLGMLGNELCEKCKHMLASNKFVQRFITPLQFLFEIGSFLRFHEPKQIALQQADIE